MKHASDTVSGIDQEKLALSLFSSSTRSAKEEARAIIIAYRAGAGLSRLSSLIAESRLKLGAVSCLSSSSKQARLPGV